MRGTRLLLVPAVAAMLTSPLVADQGKAPMRVSVTVVRSCTITADRAVVGVDCGRQQPPMRVADQASASSATNTRPGAPPRVVTIDF